MGDLVLGKNVFAKPLELEIFSQAHNAVRFVSALYTSCADFRLLFFQVYPCKLSPVEISCSVHRL